MKDLKSKVGAAIVLITHDLGIVAEVAERVMVMYAGRKVEEAPVAQLYRSPRHPYTQALLASRPSMNPKRRRTEPPLTGDPPSPIDPPSGCRFRTRCALAEAICAAVEPALSEQADGHFAACLAATPGSGHSSAAA